MRARHDGEELGPPTTNWDRMRLGGVEWRMVEPLQVEDLLGHLSVEDLDAGLRAYLTFTPGHLAIRPACSRGTNSTRVVSAREGSREAELRTTVTKRTPGWGARRAHIWR